MSAAARSNRVYSAVPPQAERFYPASTAPTAGEPTRSHFSIGPAGSSRGEGVIARSAFAAGDRLFVFAGIVVTEITQFTLQLGPREHVHDPYFMGKVLHSCEPNSRCDVAAREFTATRAISAGELVTMDYDETEERLYRAFQCVCAAPSCRGWIAGRAYAAARASGRHSRPVGA